MSDHRYVVVFDIGKTNAKMALVDLDELREIAVRQQSNAVLPGPPYPYYDIDALWRFLVTGLCEFARTGTVDAISVTTHGASLALLDGYGELAAPVLDYEYDGPDHLSTEYDAVRPDFTESGSPRLPMGLNAGAQLFWQFHTFPNLRNETKTILTYPQYWTYRLTGRAANEVTSLGCHTDLWCPDEMRFSSLVRRQGWESMMAPVRKATELLGPISARVAAETGLASDTPVYCGIHDSNASLYPHLMSRQTPFSVVSTGTWVISMAIGGDTVQLDPARDTLVNVNAFGDPVPSARFMGGREFELLMEGRSSSYSRDDIEAVMKSGAMLLPSVERRSGPFQGRPHHWTVEETLLSEGERYVVVSCYLALMTAVTLELIRAQGRTFVKGPFSNNEIYCDMLASATEREVTTVIGTGTSIGTALLTSPHRSTSRQDGQQDYAVTPALIDYARKWMAELQ